METVKSQDVYGNQYDVPVNQLTWRPAVYAVILRDGQILLVNERDAYHMPGGGVDLGETPEDAVIREVQEETGLTASNPYLVGALSTFFTLSHRRSGDPLHVQSLLLYYLCDVSGSDLSRDGLRDDEKEYGLMPEWIPLNNVNNVPVGSTVDWRPMVTRALKCNKS